jgi:hypothetical protein
MSAIGIMNFVAHDYERVWVDEVGVWEIGIGIGRDAFDVGAARVHVCLNVFSDEQTAYDDAVYTVMGKRR